MQLQRGSLQQDDLSGKQTIFAFIQIINHTTPPNVFFKSLICNFLLFYVDQKPVLSGEEQERKITTYEGAMMKIKDATGVSDIRVSLLSSRT